MTDLLAGIDVGGTKTSVCIGRANGEVLGAERILSRVQEGPDALVQRVVTLAHGLLDRLNIDLTGIQAVGMAAPGPLSVSEGCLLNPPNMTGWENVPLVAMVQQGLGRPVYMNNDANACALAEWMFGAFKGVEHLVYLTMSTGLGAGIIVNGRLLQGACDLGGEAGYHVLDAAGPESPCGHRGSFEAFCGGKNVADRLRAELAGGRVETSLLELVNGDLAQIDFRVFLQAVRDRDAYALRMWGEYVERLAQGIGNLIMILNPQAVVLGTIAVHAGDLLLEPLRQRVAAYAVPQAVAACRIEPSRLGDRIGDLSALSVAIAALSRPA